MATFKKLIKNRNLERKFMRVVLMVGGKPVEAK